MFLSRTPVSRGGNVRAVVAFTTALVLASSVASAAAYDDPNDTVGPLDVERVVFTNLREPARLRFEVQTFADWTLRRCRRAMELEDGCSVVFWLDTRGADANRQTGRGLDYRLSWRIDDCALIDPDTLSVIADGRASKIGDRVSCVIRRSALDVRKKIRWFASTTWASPSNGSYATDYAPDAGWYG
jgi:hypothetical protein